MGSVWIAGSYQSDYARNYALVIGIEQERNVPGRRTGCSASCSEVGVAPRVGGTEEDDAYLVTLTVDMNRDLSECVVFRANDVGRGSVARAQLPERIAGGTHSCWAPGESIAGW